MAARYFAAKSAALEAIGSPTPAKAGRSIFVIPKPEKEGGNDVWPHIAERWANSSRLIADIAGTRRIPYLHVLQPNRFSRPDPSYVPKDPSEESYRSLVPTAYAALRSRATDLRNSGIEVLDAGTVFAEADRSVYGTDCCHLSEAGNTLLMRLIGHSLAAAIEKQQK